MKTSQHAKDAAAQQLRAILKPGDTVWCILRHVSSSGMSRRISFVKFVKSRITKKIEPYYLDHKISDLLDLKLSDVDGLVVGGCGMDMGFHVVYNIGAKIWPDGTPKPHGSRNGKPDSDGGYALKHRWL